MSEERKIKVLIVDDSAIVRKLLSEALSAEPDLEVVGTAPDPFVARDKILSLRPDVLTLDIEMPRMDGLSFLKRLMRFHPMPVVVISSLAQKASSAMLEALRSGAVEVLGKPGGAYSVGELRHDLPHKIRAAARARLKPASRGVADKRPAKALPSVRCSNPAAIIAVGASTGGTEALLGILIDIPAGCPGIVIVQHIPPVFSTAFANRLNENCTISVREAANGDLVRPGQALIAPGNFHMTLQRQGMEYRVKVAGGERVCYQRPSVDVLFESAAGTAGTNGTGVLLTGMGSDGAQGMLKMKSAGAYTIAQDEASCVVFGMPREAIKLGAVDEILPLDRIAGGLVSRF